MPPTERVLDQQAVLRSRIEQLYAVQMHLLDSGRAKEWSETFTDDAVVDLPTLTEPLRGREALFLAVERAHSLPERVAEVQRHWHGMVAVTSRDGSDEVKVRCYALVIATPVGGEPRIHRSCVCEDVLVERDGAWLVRERRVTRDDMP